MHPTPDKSYNSKLGGILVERGNHADYRSMGSKRHAQARALARFDLRSLRIGWLALAAISVLFAIAAPAHAGPSTDAKPIWKKPDCSDYCTTKHGNMFAGCSKVAGEVCNCTVRPKSEPGSLLKKYTNACYEKDGTTAASQFCTEEVHSTCKSAVAADIKKLEAEKKNKSAAELKAVSCSSTCNNYFNHGTDNLPAAYEVESACQVDLNDKCYCGFKPKTPTKDAFKFSCVEKLTGDNPYVAELAASQCSKATKPKACTDIVNKTASQKTGYTKEVNNQSCSLLCDKADGFADFASGQKYADCAKDTNDKSKCICGLRNDKTFELTYSCGIKSEEKLTLTEKSACGPAVSMAAVCPKAANEMKIASKKQGEMDKNDVMVADVASANGKPMCEAKCKSSAGAVKGDLDSSGKCVCYDGKNKPIPLLSSSTPSPSASGKEKDEKEKEKDNDKGKGPNGQQGGGASTASNTSDKDKDKPSASGKEKPASADNDKGDAAPGEKPKLSAAAQEKLDKSEKHAAELNQASKDQNDLKATIEAQCAEIAKDKSNGVSKDECVNNKMAALKKVDAEADEAKKKERDKEKASRDRNGSYSVNDACGRAVSAYALKQLKQDPDKAARVRAFCDSKDMPRPNGTDDKGNMLISRDCVVAYFKGEGAGWMDELVDEYGCTANADQLDTNETLNMVVNQGAQVSAKVAGDMAQFQAQKAARQPNADPNEIHRESLKAMGTASLTSAGITGSVGAAQLIMSVTEFKMASRLNRAADETRGALDQDTDIACDQDFANKQDQNAAKANPNDLEAQKPKCKRMKLGAAAHAIGTEDKEDTLAKDQSLGEGEVNAAIAEQKRLAKRAKQAAIQKLIMAGTNMAAATSHTLAGLAYLEEANKLGPQAQETPVAVEQAPVAAQAAGPAGTINAESPPPTTGVNVAADALPSSLAAEEAEKDRPAPAGAIPPPLFGGNSPGGGLKEPGKPPSDSMVGPGAGAGGGGAGGGGMPGGGAGGGDATAQTGGDAETATGSNTKFEAAQSGGGFASAGGGGGKRSHDTGMDIGGLLSQFMPKNGDERKPASDIVEFGKGERGAVSQAKMDQDNGILGKNSNLFLRVSTKTADHYKKGNLR